jgi:hypothetical protein
MALLTFLPIRSPRSLQSDEIHQRDTDLPSAEVPIDLVGRLQVRMPESKHYIFEALIFPANHPEGN